MSEINAGTLIAYLRLDRSDYDAELKIAGVKADELAAKSPNIKVKVDSATALAQLAGIAAAAKRLQDAQGAERVAEQRLQDLRAKGIESGTQYVRAEENVEKARRAQAAATINLASAYAKADADAKRLGDTESSLSKFSQGAKNSTSGLITTLMAVAPAIVPIAAVAVGAAGALGLLGAAGILAVLGISNEMKRGTPLGQQYAQSIGVLKGNLKDLEHSAAQGFLGPFNAAVQRSQALMPGLNAQMQTYGRLVGNIAGHALGGLIGGLHTLDPLFGSLAITLDRGAIKFDAWAQNSQGLGKFGASAQQVLPQVVSTLGALTQAIGHVLASLGPLGGTSLTILKVFADVINALPVPVITALATAFIVLRTAALGLNVLSAVASNMQSVAKAGSAAGGGGTGLAAGLGMATGAGIILTGAMFGLTQIMGQNASRAREQARAVAEYTQAIKDANGATGAAIDASVIQQAQASGSIDAMKRIGVSTVAWTAAVEQGGGAYTALLAQLAKSGPLGVTLSGNLYEQRNAYQAAVQQAKDYASAVTENNNALALANPALAAQAQGLGITITALQGAKDAQDKKKLSDAQAFATLALAHPEYIAVSNALGVNAQAYLTAKDAIDQQKKSTADSTMQMRLANDAAGILKQTLDALNGKALSAADAQNAFDSSLTNMGDHVTATGKKVKFTTTSINDMSSASVSLRGELNGQIHNLQGVIEANGGLSSSTGQARAQMATLRQQIINNAVAHGVNRAAVTAYIDRLLAIPKSIPPTTLDANTKPATDKLNIFQRNARNKVTAELDLNASSAYATLIQFQANAKNKVAAQLSAGHNAAGTGDWRGGPTWVGENGPELVYLPQHSRIDNARKSKATSDGAGGGLTVNQTINTTKASPYQVAAESNALIAWQAAIA